MVLRHDRERKVAQDVGLVCLEYRTLIKGKYATVLVSPASGQPCPSGALMSSGYC